MATVVWTGRETHDAETFTVVRQAKVNGKSVSVYVSMEAAEDFGVGACEEVAECKILAAMNGDQPPSRVDVQRRTSRRDRFGSAQTDSGTVLICPALTPCVSESAVCSKPLY
jgi:hypothetical protein